MTVDDLKRELNKIPYSSGIVSFNDGNNTLEGYHIDKVHGIWRYYYIDDYGRYENEERFSAESELCEYILNRVRENYKFNLNKKQENKLKDKEREEKEKLMPKIIYL